MQILVEQGSITQVATPLIAVTLFEGTTSPGGATGAVDKELGGLISQLIADGEIKGKLNEVTFIHTQGKLPAARVAVVGIGPKEKLDLDVVRRASGSLAKKARDTGIKSYYTIVYGTGEGGLQAAASAQAMAEGASLASYSYTQFKSEDNESSVDRVIMIEQDLSKLAQIEEGLRRGDIFADATMMARDLASGPPNLLTPEILAERAREIAIAHGIDCTVLGPADMEKLGMGAIMAVGQGSVHPPRMVIMNYQGDPDGKRTLAIVGKGVTFDSGGISIKPAANMDSMKYDKAGAAAVIGAMMGLARLKVKANVLGIVGAVENLPSATSFRPGDIVRAFNGKSIEVVNTDAEGRLVLADALSYAVSQGADVLVDLATLTGGCVVALGTGGAGLMGNDEPLMAQLQAAGDLAGERLWPLPIWEDYLWEQVKSEVADIKNSGGRYGSAPIGALFLSKFVGEAKWAHLDIAGTAWVGSDQPSMPKSYLPRGATGFGARLLLNFVEEWIKSE